MATPTRLILALHCHQPTGNTTGVFEQAHDTCYGPIVEILHAFPRVRVSLHWSGPLMEWLEGHRPDTIAAIRELAARGQVEILGGGWQEPLLSVIPVRDAIGQLRTMRYECARLFGAMPRGMWLAERVWEPDIPSLAHEAGYGYTFLDDTHLRHAGILDDHITGHWITEKQGRPLTIFPIARSLRYAIPFRPPEETLDLLARVPGTTWTYGDDGEKFGLWPKTHEWVWEKGWLESFLKILTRATEEGALTTSLPSEVLEDAPTGRVYPPTDSYREMGEWSLPVQAAASLRSVREKLAEAKLEDLTDPFVRGGIWSGFLARYPESNWMHKHMIRVSRKVAEAEARGLKLGALPQQILDARHDLYRSQTNCAYWHGLFGGLYLPHLRRALWLHMIRAENAVDPVTGESRVTREDLDCDGSEEILVETADLIAAVTPTGGCVAELIHRPSRLNLTDTLARRPELYHSLPERMENREENGIDSIHDIERTLDDDMRARLTYDEHPRRAFQDLLLTPGEDPALLETGECQVLHDLRAERWEVLDVAGGDRGRVTLTTRRPDLSITKQLTFHAGEPRLAVAWELQWSGENPLEAVLVSQINIDLLAGHSTEHGYRRLDPPGDLDGEEGFLDSRGRWDRTASFALFDRNENLRITLETSPVCDVVRHPVETVSQSESGFELTFQGSCVQLCWALHLESWAPWKGRCSMSITAER